MEQCQDVCFIPPPPDVAVTSAPTARKNPFVLLWQDITTFFSMIYLLPKIMYPFFTDKPGDELYLGGKNIFYLALLALVTILSGIFTIILLPAAVILPGIATFSLAALGYGTIYWLCYPIKGPMVVESSPDILRYGEAERWKDEKWIFVNGTLVTNHCLQENCNRISRTFGRPITGLHNPTLGLIGDITECIIQRSFSYNTYCTRYTYDYVKARLADPGVKKVVLLGHSQGGIEISMVLDLLFADMPVENISKLEVYTFGCAASHFNNPLRAIEPNSQTARARVIPYMEHYANSDDLVTRWGVLYNVCTAPTNSFMGKIFVRRNATGHLLNQHYLSNMFPLPGEKPDSTDGTSFLDQVADVYEKLTLRRKRLAMTNCPPVRQTPRHPYGSFTGSNDLEQLNPASDVLDLDDGSSGFRFVTRGRQISEGGQPLKPNKNGHMPSGRTVRELSRLWRYMGGMDPDRQGLLPL
ncbi:hypothetical protein FQN54_002371 [Arachnomyces sp. PD_36]|nr:hypothetical protein FQN54_002371 [Arachnomyces sp. PD_36]